MQELVYKLKNLLSDLPVVDWKRAIIFAMISEDSYKITFYLTDFNNKNIQCYELCKMGCDEDLIDQIQDNIYELLWPHWKDSQKEHPWTNCTIIINVDDSFSANYDNSDFKDGFYEYQEEWKKKYLK